MKTQRMYLKFASSRIADWMHLESIVLKNRTRTDRVRLYDWDEEQAGMPGSLRYLPWRAVALRRRALRAMKPVASSWL